MPKSSYINEVSGYTLGLKLKTMEDRQAKLAGEVESGYSEEKYRALSLLNYHVSVMRARISGDYVRQDATKSQNKKQRKHDFAGSY